MNHQPGCAPLLNEVVPQAAINALVVDDHPLFREALAGLLRRASDGPMTIVQAASAEGALEQVATRRTFDIVAMDLDLPGENGPEAIAALRRALPAATIIVVSGSEQRRDIQAAMRAGARAFVSKSVAPDVLITTLRRALQARMQAPEVISSDIRDEARSVSVSLQALTPRQREVLLLMSKGQTNKEIGLRLGLAEITIKQHVSRVFVALGVTNRLQAVMTARRLVLEATSALVPQAPTTNARHTA